MSGIVNDDRFSGIVGNSIRTGHNVILLLKISSEIQAAIQARNLSVSQVYISI
ncbi:MAG: hypothetical protein NT010_04170 [Proteobacteria bacterium]|nr:hypothetical protein [Pseudomonadota bacterium]